MKAKFLFSAAILAITCVVFGFTTPGNGEKNEVTVRKFTLEELKKTYGDNITIQGNVDLESLKTVEIMSASNPCAGSGLQPCEGAENQARNRAQQLANACCCTVVYGWECCDPHTGASFAALFLTEPNNCH